MAMRCWQLPFPSHVSGWLQEFDEGLPHGVFADRWFSWQIPCASQISCPEQSFAPEPHVRPGEGVNVLGETAGLQTKQGLLAASLPLVTQTPLMRQPLHVLTHESDATSQARPVPHVLKAGLQASDPSSHTEIPLHATPSSHS
jgi:hypothetical protein